MGFMKVNLSDVESFEPLPEDEYAVEIEKVEVRQNKAGDGLYLNWELVVLDGDHENRRLWYITSLKDTALFRLKQTFVNLGVIDEDDDELELEYDDDVEPSSSAGPVLLYPEVEGTEAVAVVKNEMYDGRERNRVNDLFTEQRPKSTKKNRKVAPERKSRDTGRSSRNSQSDDDEDEEEDEPRRVTSRSARTARSASNGQRRRRIR